MTINNECGQSEVLTLQIQSTDCMDIVNEVHTLVSIHPNPLKEVFTIDLHHSNLIGSTYEIMNATGQVVKHGSLLTQSIIIDVGNLSGLYMLRINSGETSTIHRLVFN